MKQLLALLVAVAASVDPAAAQDFKVYPGAKADAESTREGSDGKTRADYEFYKAHYQEFEWKLQAPTLPSGKPVRWAFFILDGAKDLKESKLWIKIQYPYIRTVDGRMDFKDIRNISVIQAVHR